MKKTFKYEGKSCSVEIQSAKSGHTITGVIDGKVETVKILPPEDDVSHYAGVTEDELKLIIDKPSKKANPHIKKLKEKGYK